MSSEANPVADSSSPTVNELIMLLRSSFFPHEFDYVAKTLTDREECLNQKCVKLTGEIDDLMKANADVMREFEVYEKRVLEIIEEKGLLVLMNGECEKRIRAYEKRSSDDLAGKLKVEKEKKVLVDELETKRSEIGKVLKANDEYEREIAVYRKRFSDDSEFRKKAEEEKKVLVLENLKLNGELKARRDEIDAVKAECEGRIRDYETRYLDELGLKLKAEEEKKVLVLENLKLNGELKVRRDKIVAVMKVKADYETRYLDELALKLKAEEEKKLLDLENLKLNDELKARRDEIDAVKAEEEKKLLDLENLKLNDELKARRGEIDAVKAEYKTRYLDELALKLKAEEEKKLLDLENLKLNDELKARRDEIDAVKAECERRIRVYGTRYLDELALKLKAEEEKQLLALELKARRNETDAATQAKTIAEDEKKRVDLENVKLLEELKKKGDETDAVNSEHESKFRAYEKQCLELKRKNEAMVHAHVTLNGELQSKIRAFESKYLESNAKVLSSGKTVVETDCGVESSRKVGENERSKRKIEHVLREIIEIDDDDDDNDDGDFESVSRTKRRHAYNEKTELKYTSEIFKTCRNKK